MKKLLFMAGLLSASAITADAVAQSYNPYYPSNVPNNYSAPKRSASSRKDDFKKFSIGLDYVITDATMANHSFSIDSPLLGGTPYSGTLDNFEDSLDTLSGSIGWRPLRYLGFEVFYQQSLSDNQIKYQESYAQDTRFAQAEYEFEYKAYGADAILYLPVLSRLELLASAGLANYDFQAKVKLNAYNENTANMTASNPLKFDEDKLAFRYGLGAQLFLSERLAFRAMYRYTQIDVDYIDKLSEISLGVRYNF